MRIRQLDAFRATIITGTMSAAADSLKTSQPTVSRLISELETELKLQLFRREKGRIHPTHEGLEFYRRVDKVHDAFASLKNVAQDLRESGFREVRIMATPAVSMAIVPALMEQLVCSHPDISARLITVDKKSYFEAKCENSFDIFIGNKMGFEGGTEQVELGTVDFICAVPKGHRLAKSAIITLADLEGEHVISQLDDDNRLFLQHERLFEEHDIAMKRNIYADTSSTAYHMVARGMGLSVLEPLTAPLWIGNGVAIRPFRPKLSYSFVAGIKPGAHQSSIISEIIEIARGLFAASAAWTQGL